MRPTGSNEVSVAEDEVMRILLLVRNFLPAHEEVAEGEVRSHSCILQWRLHHKQAAELFRKNTEKLKRVT